MKSATVSSGGCVCSILSHHATSSRAVQSTYLHLLLRFRHDCGSCYGRYAWCMRKVCAAKKQGLVTCYPRENTFLNSKCREASKHDNWSSIWKVCHWPPGASMKLIVQFPVENLCLPLQFMPVFGFRMDACLWGFQITSRSRDLNCIYYSLPTEGPFDNLTRFRLCRLAMCLKWGRLVASHRKIIDRRSQIRALFQNGNQRRHSRRVLPSRPSTHQQSSVTSPSMAIISRTDILLSGGGGKSGVVSFVCHWIKSHINKVLLAT
jgi:hypothetical protein